MTFLRTAAATLLVAFAAAAHAVIAVPPAGHRVTDLTGTLSTADTELVAHDLVRIEKATKAQLAVLIVDSLDGEPIEDYSQRVFDAWKPGRAGENDGALLVLAKKERRMRIAIGRGLEGAVPDLEAKRVTSGKMAPAFKQGAFATGFVDAANELERLIKVEQASASTPAPAPKAAAAEETPAPWLLVFVALGFGGLAIFGLGSFVSEIVGSMRKQKASGVRVNATSDLIRAHLRAQLAEQRRREASRPRPSFEPRPQRSSSRSLARSDYTGAAVAAAAWSSGSSGGGGGSNDVSYGGGNSAGGGASDSY